MRKLLSAAAIAVSVVAAPSVIGELSASADGTVSCNKNPAKPDMWGSSGAEYWGTGKCTGTNHDAFRFRVGLAQEKVNWGPIPNDWIVVDSTLTSYSTWAANGGSRYKEGYASCSEIKDDWYYKNNYRYHNVWSDGHETYKNYQSDEQKLC